MSWRSCSGKKRPLLQSFEENNVPQSKRLRRQEDFIQEEVEPPVTRDLVTNPRRRRRRRGTQRANNDAFEPRHRTKRRQQPSIEQDENEIGELTARLKRARLRPVFFTISSFIEQTVDDVSVTVGDEDDLDNNNGDNAEQTATFTFVLPVATSPRSETSDESNRHGQCNRRHCSSNTYHEA